jgi:hypothetical protein
MIIYLVVSEFCVTIYLDCDVEVNLDSGFFGSFKGNMTVPKDLKIITVEYVDEVIDESRV